MIAPSYPPLTLAVEPIDDQEAVGARWRTLEEAVPHSFFQSWHWIGCLLATVSHKAHLLTMAQEGEIVAMAVLFGMNEARADLAPGARLALNRVGEAAYDCVYPEYNGFLCSPVWRQPSLHQLLLAMAGAGCERLELGGLEAEDTTVVAPPGWSIRHLNMQGYYQVDMQRLRAEGRNYDSALSGNTRQQIRRSIRTMEERAGPITLKSAKNVNESLQMLDRLALLHQSQWQDRGEAGAFSEPFFRTFHKKLITTGFHRDVLELISISAGEQEIGHLYNFCYGGQIYYYQSGFVKPRGKHDRPGLVSLFLNVERHMKNGGKVYDFLAGDQRYKSSLAEYAGSMVWMEANRSSVKYRLTNVLRNVKSWSIDSLIQK